MAKKDMSPKVALVAEVVPSDELDAVMDSHRRLKIKWENVAPDPEEINILELQDSSVFDGYVKEELVLLSGKGVRNSLKKLAWTAFCLFDPEYMKDWNEGENRVQSAMVHRLSETDVFLTEYREIKAHKEGVWLVSFQSDTGEVIQRERVFPFWGREHKLGLDSKEKATKFYRQQLKERQIL